MCELGVCFFAKLVAYWNHIIVYILLLLDRINRTLLIVYKSIWNTWKRIIMHKLLVLGKNIWNSIVMYELLVFDQNTWNYIIIKSEYLKLYNYVQIR